MKTENCYYLGYISKTIGFEGDLLTFFDHDPSPYIKLESVFIQIDGKLVPFFIEEIIIRAKNKEVVIAFEDVYTTEKARKLCNRKMFLPLHLHPEKEKHHVQYQGINGYLAVLADNTPIGTIDEVIEYPGNPLFKIVKEGRETLIPIAEKFILHVDHAQKTITLSVPDGLIDINKP